MRDGSPDNRFQIDRIQPAEFLKIGTEWNEALRISGSDNIHLRHEWLAAWASTMGNDRDALVLRVRQGNQTVGFAPLQFHTIRLKHLLPYKQILFLGDPESDFADFVVTGDREAVLRAVVSHLRNSVSWGELLLHNLPERSPNAAPLRTILAESGLRHEISVATPCYFIPMKGRTWEAYLKSDVNSKFVSGIGGVQKRYTYYKKCRWEIQELPVPALDDGLYQSLMYLHECSQKRKERSSQYREERFRRFLDRVAAGFSQAGWFRLMWLRLDGKPASFILGFEHNRVFYHWNIGFDLEFEKLAPSKFLLWHVLKDGFERKRWDEFNFMRGATDYKLHWTTSSYNLFQVRVLNAKGSYGALNRLRQRTLESNGNTPGGTASSTEPAP